MGALEECGDGCGEVGRALAEGEVAPGGVAACRVGEDDVEVAGGCGGECGEAVALEEGDVGEAEGADVGEAGAVVGGVEFDGCDC